ncbi:MAG: Gfo/Idh/MocA family oxidoreductase, partial [Treponema sp.]|nr:Gfo/Idh/MocA family oxidoreductase [Treponema sp.]
MEKFRKVKTAVAGCGMISDIYLQNMTSIFEILDLVGCCDVIPERMESRAKKYGIKSMTMEAILQDKSIELVVNLTTPAFHHQVTKQALEAGKHVYCEKPIDLSIEAARELVQLADAKGLLYGCAPDTFMGSAIQTARFALDSGLVGEVSSCYAALNLDAKLLAERFPFTALPGGGIGLDRGVYYLTALLSILGPVTEVCGFVKTLHPRRQHCLVSRPDFGEPFTLQAENLAAGSFHLASGALGTIHFNANSIQNEKPQIVLYGSEGILYMPDPNLFGGEVKVLLKG